MSKAGNTCAQAVGIDLLPAEKISTLCGVIRLLVEVVESDDETAMGAMCAAAAVHTAKEALKEFDR